MKRIDIILALITGEVTALFFYLLFKNTALGLKIGFLWPVLMIAFPILALVALWLSWLLARKFLWIFQAAKYLLIGVLATLVDLSILNVLILMSGVASGLSFSIFKGISFLVATFAKYVGDKFWAFEKMERTGLGKEFSQFFLVTLIGLAINVGTATLTVNLLGPKLPFTKEIIANIGGIAAAFGAVAWNFIGYKFIVFKK